MVKISQGNSKLNANKGEHIPNVSLTPIKACTNCNQCKKDCYALKSYRAYPNVKNAWDSNFKLVKTNRKQFFADIDIYIGKKQPRLFRWHVAGDIIDQDYFNNMKILARKHPKVKFLAFTKSYHIRFYGIPDNLSIVLSAWPGLPLPKKNLPIAYYQDGTETRVKNAIECFGRCDTCGMCWSLKKIGKNVVFHKH